MKKYLILMVMTLCCLSDAVAQNAILEVIRLPGQPQNFITATQPFSLLIRLRNARDVSFVGFELAYNNAGSVAFDGYDLPFSSPFNGRGVATALANSNSVNGVGTIIVVVRTNGNGTTDFVNTAPPGGTMDVIQLNFTCQQEALHNTTTRFSFIDPLINIFDISSPTSPITVRPTVIPVDLRIRGFIDVWPGDANGDREVRISDLALVAKYYGNGPASSLIRGYPRSRVSGIWASQRALAWDTVEATGADCNGNGLVDINDYVVVFSNYGRTRVGKKLSPQMQAVEIDSMKELQDQLSPPFQMQQEQILIPLEVRSKEYVVGMAARFQWKHHGEDYRVVGIQRAGRFASADAIASPFDNNTKIGEVAVGSYYPAPEVLANGAFAVVIVEKLNPSAPEFKPEFLELNGMKADGEWVNFLNPVSVDEQPTSPALTAQVFPNPVQEMFSTRFYLEKPATVSVYLYNSLGSKVRTFAENQSVGAGTFSFQSDVQGLSSGVYYMVVHVGTETFSYPVTVAR